MRKHLLKDLTDLEQASIISPGIAADIRNYYAQKEEKTGNRLLTIFGILGACLVGLGIILIIAHNWDDLNRVTKTILAFFPIVTGQCIAFYVLLKKQDNIAWRESAATFLFFALGACISLVSQIYNIPGNLGSYLLTWSLLSLPVFYLLRSSMVSLMYLATITWFACETEYFSRGLISGQYYWLLLAAALPYYIQLLRQQTKGNFTTFHNWIYVLSLIICLGIIAQSNEQWLFAAYMSLFGIFYLLGRSSIFSSTKRINNSYLLTGSAGTLFLLLMLSFDWLWVEINKEGLKLSQIIDAPEFVVFVVTTTIAILLYIKNHKDNIKGIVNPLEGIFLLFAILFIIGHFNPIIPIIVINITVLGIGLFYINYGTQENHLGLLNYGLLIITTLVICRFFDTDISFVLRGFLFILVGAGFFVANSRMLKKRRNNE